MMFGPGMPILFRFCFYSMLVLYFLESFMLYYIYKRPPAYDADLNDHVLGMLSWAPVVMLGFSYWMYSNPLLLGTYKDMHPIKTSNTPFTNHHHWYKALGFDRDLE